MADKEKEEKEEKDIPDQLQAQDIPDRPKGQFGCSQKELVLIALAAGQDRNFAEEVEQLNEKGGEQWIEQGLMTDFVKGLSCLPYNESEPDKKTNLRQDHKSKTGPIKDWKDRQDAYQDNEREIAPSKTFMQLLLMALDDFILKILIAAAAVSMIIELSTADSHELQYAWTEGFAILVAVMVCSLVAAVNDYQKEKQFQYLHKVADAKKIITVIREGRDCRIHQDFVMAGDIIKLVEGMEIPADGFIIKASSVTCDESAMTGETDPLKKDILSDCITEMNKIIAEGNRNTAGKHAVPSPLLMSGTKILTGEGLMVVAVVGPLSCMGQIRALLDQKEQGETPLQEKLGKIATDIGYFGLYSAISIVVVMLIRFMIERIYLDEFDGKEHTLEILDFFIIGITVIVVAIPEGLPLAVTLSLAYSVKKMLEEANLVRQLQACETMGGANNICSDKTGTLTKNEMTLVKWWNIDQIEFKSEAKEYDLDQYMGPEFKEYFLAQTAVNCSADLIPEETGSKTETAILKFLQKTAYKYPELRQKFQVFKKFPFSSARKRMSTIIDFKQGQQIILVKGASEMVLKSCTKWQNRQNNEIKPIDQNQRQLIEAEILQMAQNALRTICIAYKELRPGDNIETCNDLGVFDIEQNDLVLLGVLGIADVVRDEVPGAVKKCFQAGIKVRMVTGDNKDTARAIAIQCGIVSGQNKDDLVIEGPEFIQKTGGVVCKKCRTAICDCPKNERVDTILNQKAFNELYPNLCVMARSRPADKYALVTGLIERGNIVAVTGDGTNDAPALKKADVGFAMGNAGTQVAKDASDIILMDDNFNSIVKAVKWGRNIYDSVKKFLQFQLTVNVVAVSITLIGAAVIKQEVLTPIQMLWVNLIMDTFASLALATEPPTEELLDRPPHNRNEYIVSKKMTKHIFGQSILQAIILLLFLFGGDGFLPEWDSDKFDDEGPKLLNDYYKNLSTKGKQNNESLRYVLRNSEYGILYSDADKNYVVSGRLKSLDGLYKEYYHIEKVYRNPSRHFTYIFNVFVLLQVFNFLNARKLRDEYNIFEGITRNYLFGVIVGIIVGFQIIVVTFGGYPFHCFAFYGLNIYQWLICIGFGVLGNVLSIFIKMIPEEQIFKCKIYENAEGDSEKDSDNPDKLAEDPAQQQEQHIAVIPQQETRQQPATELTTIKKSENNQKNSKAQKVESTQEPEPVKQTQEQPVQQQQQQQQQQEAAPQQQQNTNTDTAFEPIQTEQLQQNNESQAKQAPEDDESYEQRDVQAAGGNENQ